MIRRSGLLATLWLILASVATAQDRPVVVELYTSQGCASCPPAVSFFRKNLADRDDVIALALHVDYWDYIGWKDSFAAPAYSARQKAFARALGKRSVYTPQMIVDGEDDVVGTYPDKVEGLIKAHKSALSPVDLKIERRGDKVWIAARSSVSVAMDVQLVRYVDEEIVNIRGGENAGRIMTYRNIVNDWKVVTKWNGDRPLNIETTAPGSAPVVVLIQRAGSGPILAAARLR
ncbi:DUF1223 domain-containing protein [Thiosulfatihalobacter marinus]|jgi:hypothetical protein|uniref:DUF1223 domain-containing protein n=1 Tax=Thiosulfatihalobacter marinus TaxID=2792481 RepID=UPI0018D692FE|nr:DUF1223 domain-containing protein [Thiosulfatihalobacter marinus]